MTGIRVTSEPTVARSQDGTVHVLLDDDNHWAVFRTEAHYRAWREQLDREEVSFDLDHWRDCRPLEEYRT
jgi:hypothetical protein